MSETRDPESVAAGRYTVLNLLRLGAVIAVALGIAMARGAVPGPYPLGAVLAIAGLAAFFFGPYILVKRWKARDKEAE